METRYLKTLLKACETGSFSRAAEELHITQSAASQRVKFLEESYGQQLLDRSGPVMVPTEAGALVLAAAREILARENALIEELKRLKVGKRLSICCTPTFGMAHLPGVLNDFVMQNADVADLKFIFKQPAEAIKGVQDKEYDLAVIEHCDAPLLKSFACHALPDDELVFISSPALKLPSGELEIGQLLELRLYARRDGCSSKNLLTRNLAAVGVGIDDFRTVVISDDLRLSIESVLAGGGVSFVSRSLVQHHLDEGRLCAHYVKGFQHLRERTLFYDASRMDDPLLENFVACVFSVFKAQKGGGFVTLQVRP